MSIERFVGASPTGQVSALLVLASMITVHPASSQPVDSSPSPSPSTAHLTTSGLLGKILDASDHARRLGELAVSRGASPEVRRFGRLLVADGAQFRRSLRAYADGRHLAIHTPSPTVSELRETQQREHALAALASERGPAFDRALLQHLVPATRAALYLLSDGYRTTRDPRLQMLLLSLGRLVRQHVRIGSELLQNVDRAQVPR
jgi:predicted outer membrane protein